MAHLNLSKIILVCSFYMVFSYQWYSYSQNKTKTLNFMINLEMLLNFTNLIYLADLLLTFIKKHAKKELQQLTDNHPTIASHSWLSSRVNAQQSLLYRLQSTLD